MDPLIRTVSAWDGLPLCVREWDGGDSRPAVLCLPGLVRTGGDFSGLADAISDGRRVVAVDYAGRGTSGRSSDVKRYAPEACARDVMDVAAALRLHRAIVIGTSFGGLLAMGLAVARPSLLRAVVLNDIGPEVGSSGATSVRDFVGHDPALESLDACVALLRENLPPLSLETEASWREMAALTYSVGADGRFHPTWDIRIASLLGSPLPDLWPMFGMLATMPLLVVRGEVSDILLADTVAGMRAVCPDLAAVTVPSIGHAPTLTEPSALAAIIAFLEQNH